MKQLLSYAVLSVLCLTGCTNTSRQTVQELPRIQLNEDYPKKEIWLQDVADVEYIPLETNDKTLFNGSIVALSKEGILGMNRKEGRFFVFDGNGKSQSSFSRKGGGPEEYADLQQAVIDWKRKELYVLDPKSRICVYSPDGTFKRMLETKTIIRERDVCNYTDDLLMLFREIPEGGNAEKKTAESMAAPFYTVSPCFKTTRIKNTI